jgi:hypothetical protein
MNTISKSMECYMIELKKFNQKTKNWKKEKGFKKFIIYMNNEELSFPRF